MSDEFLQVVTSVDAEATAGDLARSAVAARLAACAQVGGPVTSTYRWNDAVETAQEWVVTLKTTADRYPALEAHLRAAHPYQVPEIVCVPIVGGNPDYLAWLATETAPTRPA